MLSSQYLLPLHGELVVDLFAGGGGASTGIEQAIGRAVDVAINHDLEAISLHQANHPQTEHYCSDVFEVDPAEVTRGMPVGLLWASPDCKHFSKAKGGKPVSKSIRSLAWVVVKWSKAVRPRVICLENVEEFVQWGPIATNQLPCPKRKGKTFKQWVASLRALGYQVEWQEMRACDFGAPTTRKRLYLIARCDGAPITWPSPTHGDPKRLQTKALNLKPWRTAAECIDWSLPTPSIFDRTRPLADATLRRIANGIVRFVVQAEKPFIQPATGDAPQAAKRAATLVQTGYGERKGQAPRLLDIESPLGTVVGTSKHGLVIAFLAKHYTGVVGSALSEPIGTVTTVDHHSVVAAYICKMRGDNLGHAADEPLHTVSAGGQHHAHVSALLVKYCGNERFGLVTVMLAGEPYVIADIGMRMLQPHELYAAQGFPASYRIAFQADGKPLTQKAQIRMCGNSVSPYMARHIVAANYTPLEMRKCA
jgi:DNA (cytosine-5)-methyltransferase 1